MYVYTVYMYMYVWMYVYVCVYVCVYRRRRSKLHQGASWVWSFSQNLQCYETK